MKTESVAVGPAKINLFSLSMAIVLLLLLLPRPLTYLGLPFFVNFLHYPFVLVLYLTTILFPGRTYDRFFPGLTILLIVICLSALLNGAGVINVILDFLLLSEPFMILALMTGSLWNPASTHKLTRIIFFLMFLHLIFAYAQFPMTSDPDDVKGLFIAMGAGHHVGGAVALTAAVYFLITSPPRSVFMRLVFPFILATIVIISDSKQVVLVFGLSLGVMGFLAAEYLVAFKTTQAFQLIKFTIIPAAVILIILPFAVSPADIERVLSNGFLGLEHKISVFSMLWSFNESSLNALFGLGPGHTIGRLAQMLPRYWDMLVGLGATRKPFTVMLYYADQASPYGLAGGPTGTSLFSLRYSWPGIWGDLGVAGIVSYLALWALVWKRICRDFLSKFFVCNVIIFGMVYSWLEEPGYMGVVAIFIGLRWQAVGHGETGKHERSTRPYFHGKSLDGGIRPFRGF